MKRPPKADYLVPHRTDLGHWWNKQTAARALNVSTKTIERLAADGEIHAANYKRPEGGAVIRVYHPADIERLRKKQNPEAAPFVVPDGETKALERTAAAPASSGPAEQWEHALAVQIAKAGQLFLEAEHHHQAPAELPVTEVLFLTLPQAVRLSGLPASLLREMPAVKTGRGWRYRREDVEALTLSDVESLQETARWKNQRQPVAGRPGGPEPDTYRIPRVTQAEIDARLADEPAPQADQDTAAAAERDRAHQERIDALYRRAADQGEDERVLVNQARSPAAAGEPN